MNKAKPGPESHYVHGTTPREQERLSLLNELINEGSLAEMALAGGERILDVGSGLGQFSRAMARAAGPGGRVVGIERSSDQISRALDLAREAGEDGCIELRQGAVDAPPLAAEEWGTFDVAHARFVLEHVPGPGAVVEMMLRAVRPGGRIILEDDDHDVFRLWPEPAGWRPLWEAYIRTYDRLGNDPYIGRRLVSLLHGAGARVVRNTWLFFGCSAGTSTMAAMVENLAGVLEGAAAAMVQGGFIEAPAVDEAIAVLRAWGRRPDAALWYARCWAEGTRP
jgi:SAM-dependent methyltransferase